MNTFLDKISSYFDWFYFPSIKVTDIIEIIILAFLIYNVINWFKKTRAWTLVKGLMVLVLFALFAAIFKLNTILWIMRNTISVGIIAVIILFQPELRRALEELGRKNIVPEVFYNDKAVKSEKLNDNTIAELVAAAIDMSKNKTGALIVIENSVALGEYESTGIKIDATVSRQLLVNIFEHNTPLHDGAVIIRNNRIVAATCYLPLTDRNDLNKDLGTRHRAAVGISEVSDSMTLIVSEESGAISIAHSGTLYRNLDSEGLKKHLSRLQNKTSEPKRFRRKGGKKNEKQDAK
ncbi:MAG: diadenylate cyclase CdaA [Lachnospiraceae bacterium]|nr:diadenylate cyclase CdaA [Lachnospiraceae bacterium]